MKFNLTLLRNLTSIVYIILIIIFITSINSFAQIHWNTELLGRWAEGTCDAVEVDDNYIYIGNGSYIDVYEDQDEPTIIARLETPGIIRDILRVGDYLYVADEEYGLRIFNVNDINNSYETGFILLPGYTQKLLMRDSIIYSANFHGGLRIINIKDPSNPIELSYYQSSYQVNDFIIKNNYIFVSQGAQLYSGFAILDISDPSNPIFIKMVYTQPMEYSCRGLAVKDESLFVITTNGSYGYTYIYTISDPSNPELKFHTGDIYGTMIKIKDNYAFITQCNEIKIVDISKHDTLSLLAIINSYGEKKSLRFKGNSMYVADSYYGLVIIDINDLNNPIYKYHIPSAYNTGYLIVDDNLVYVSDMGLRILDVTAPYNPKRIGVFQTIYGTDKIFKKDNLVFLVDGNIGGMRIIDVEYPNFPLELSQIKPTQNFIISATAYQDYLYLAQGDSLGIWDITEPYYPIHVNTIHLAGYCSELIIKDSLLITCQAPPGGILIYNLNNPEFPNLLSTFITEYESQHLARQGNYIIGGGYAGFEIIDITNPAQPYHMSFFSTPYIYDLAAINNYLYVAFAEAGIKVYDLNNVLVPQEVGYYDTKGIAWSVDCWDDKIFVADARYGVPIIRNTLITNIDDQQALPPEFKLSQNYPNPFNPTTTINWQIPEAKDVKIKIYDLLGREITTLINEYRPAGKYTTDFDASTLPSGVYFYQLKAGDIIQTKKMILMK
jgi:hypothetical protein